MIKRYKIRDRYYHVIVDGTGLAARRKLKGINYQHILTFL